jgi:AraC-like DNA-binding protein
VRQPTAIATSTLVDGEPAVRGYAVTHPAGRVVLPAAAGWHQLLFASAGVMTVETEAERWVVPPHRALWMPEGARPRIVMHGRTSIRALYLGRELAVSLQGWRVVNVSPLLRELIIHAVALAPLDLARADHARLIGVLLDQLAGMAQQPLVLPHPADERALALARAIAGPDGHRTVDELAREVGASRRTLERTFLAETGLTIGAWRQRQRLLRALELLARGDAVTSVALAVGYRTPSAFTAMFHEQLGTTPTRYFDPDR